MNPLQTVHYTPPSGHPLRPLVQGIFLVVNLALFAYAFADWRGWLPFERGFQPLQVVLLAGALVLQPLASLAQRRSMLLWFTLLAASIALLAASVLVHSQ
jgi:hypothetical protein